MGLSKQLAYKATFLRKYNFKLLERFIKIRNKPSNVQLQKWIGSLLQAERSHLSRVLFFYKYLNQTLFKFNKLITTLKFSQTLFKITLHFKPMRKAKRYGKYRGKPKSPGEYAVKGFNQYHGKYSYPMKAKPYNVKFRIRVHPLFNIFHSSKLKLAYFPLKFFCYRIANQVNLMVLKRQRKEVKSVWEIAKRKPVGLRPTFLYNPGWNNKLSMIKVSLRAFIPFLSLTFSKAKSQLRSDQLCKKLTNQSFFDRPLFCKLHRQYRYSRDGEIEEDVVFICQVLKFLLRYPILKPIFVKYYPRFWLFLSKYCSVYLKSFLFIKDWVGASRALVSVETGSQELMYAFPNLRSSIPRLHKLFFDKLQKKYGPRPVQIVFRLDEIPNKRRRRNRLSVTQELYRMRRKLRKLYGNLTPRQLWQIRKLASNLHHGFNTGIHLLLFESRLDIFLIRTQIVDTIVQARNIITNKFVLINGLIITTFKYIVNIADRVSIIGSAHNFFQSYLLERIFSQLQSRNLLNRIFPVYLEISYKLLMLVYIPKRFTLRSLPILFKFKHFLLQNCGKFAF